MAGPIHVLLVGPHQSHESNISEPILIHSSHVCDWEEVRSKMCSTSSELGHCEAGAGQLQMHPT